MPEKEKPEEKGKKPEEKKQERPKERRMLQIIRISETNLDGTKPVRVAIRRVKGISFMLSNAVAKACGFGNKKLGDLTEQEQKTLENIIANPDKHNIPQWLYNRRRDPITGEDRHTTVSRLDLTGRMDIDSLKKKRCYRGIRHELRLPVRGQRTRSSFRKAGKAMGVRRKKTKGGETRAR